MSVIQLPAWKQFIHCIVWWLYSPATSLVCVFSLSLSVWAWWLLLLAPGSTSTCCNQLFTPDFHQPFTNGISAEAPQPVSARSLFNPSGKTLSLLSLISYFLYTECSSYVSYSPAALLSSPAATSRHSSRIILHAPPPQIKNNFQHSAVSCVWVLSDNVTYRSCGRCIQWLLGLKKHL